MDIRGGWRGDGVRVRRRFLGGGGAAAGAGGGALYFAQAPPQHVERYCAVLTSRPPGPVREGAAVVVMPRASPPTFVVGLYKLSPVDP